MTLLIALVAALASCNQSAGNQEGEQNAEMEKIVSATVEELVSNPDEYMDLEVAVSGMVTHVCRHGGQKCFIVGKDGETQIRIVPSGDIDEFKLDLEGSTVAFKGTFKVMHPVEAEAHVEDHNSKAHHAVEMAHSQAEKADIFIEASEFQEMIQ
jgi:hypothetical protein